MKNDEFDATRLESWATMLISLKDIAANRMPSVSDLLKQTASAAGGKPGDAASSSGAPLAQSQRKPTASTGAQQSAPVLLKVHRFRSPCQTGQRSLERSTKPAAPIIVGSRRRF